MEVKDRWYIALFIIIGVAYLLKGKNSDVFMVLSILIIGLFYVAGSIVDRLKSEIDKLHKRIELLETEHKKEDFKQSKGQNNTLFPVEKLSGYTLYLSITVDVNSVLKATNDKIKDFLGTEPIETICKKADEIGYRSDNISELHLQCVCFHNYSAMQSIFWYPDEKIMSGKFKIPSKELVPIDVYRALVGGGLPPRVGVAEDYYICIGEAVGPDAGYDCRYGSFPFYLLHSFFRSHNAYSNNIVYQFPSSISEELCKHNFVYDIKKSERHREHLKDEKERKITFDDGAIFDKARKVHSHIFQGRFCSVSMNINFSYYM